MFKICYLRRIGSITVDHYDWKLELKRQDLFRSCTKPEHLSKCQLTDGLSKHGIVIRRIQIYGILH